MKSKNGRSLLLNGLPYAATPGGFSIRGGVLGYPQGYLCGNSRKRVVYKPTWTIAAVIGQAYTRRTALSASERSGQRSTTVGLPEALRSKLRLVSAVI